VLKKTGSSCAYRSPGRFAIPLLAAAVIGFVTPALVVAQADGPTDADGYRILPPVQKFLDSPSEEIRVKTHVKGVITGKNLLSDNQTMFDAYYNRHFFPMMTRTDPKALQELPEERFRFIRDHLEAATNPEVHEHVVDLALANLTPIVQNNFHPIVRYNALLIIGSINQTEAVRIGGAKATPEPHIRALPVLYTEFTRAENPDLLKVAALIGLVRHMEWDAFRTTPIPAAQRAAVVKALQDLASQKQPPEGRTAEGHQWMRRRAIEALGYSNWSKADPAVVEVLNTVLTDKDEPLDVRATAATALGRSNIVAPSKLEVATTAKELGHLAVLSCMSELERVTKLKEKEEEQKKLLGNRSSGGYGGGYESMPSYGGYGGMEGGLFGNTAPQDPKAYRIDPMRRKMRARLYGVQVGLTGPIGDNTPTRGAERLAKTPAEKDAVKKIRESLEKVIAVVETPDQSMEDFEKALRKAIKPLDDLTKMAKPAVAPAADTPADEPDIGAPPAGPTAGGDGKAGRPAVRPTAAPAAEAAPAAGIEP